MIVKKPFFMRARQSGKGAESVIDEGFDPGLPTCPHDMPVGRPRDRIKGRWYKVAGYSTTPPAARSRGRIPRLGAT
jgi:hypothetical protein